MDKKIILFDGVCNLCNRSVQFVIKRDKNDKFRFAALQSEFGKQFLRERKIDSTEVDSIILLEPDLAYYTRSSAILEIGKSFGGVYSLLAIFQWIPRPIRDWVYDLIAKRRYRWFGQKESCMVPTAGVKAKFL